MKFLVILLVGVSAQGASLDTRANCERQWDQKNRDAMHEVQAYLKTELSNRANSMSCDFNGEKEAVCTFRDGKVKHIKIDQKCMEDIKTKPDYQKNQWVYRAGCLVEAYGFWEHASTDQEKVLCRPEPEYLKTASVESTTMPRTNGRAE